MKGLRKHGYTWVDDERVKGGGYWRRLPDGYSTQSSSVGQPKKKVTPGGKLIAAVGAAYLAGGIGALAVWANHNKVKQVVDQKKAEADSKARKTEQKTQEKAEQKISQESAIQYKVELEKLKSNFEGELQKAISTLEQQKKAAVTEKEKEVSIVFEKKKEDILKKNEELIKQKEEEYTRKIQETEEKLKKEAEREKKIALERQRKELEKEKKNEITQLESQAENSISDIYKEAEIELEERKKQLESEFEQKNKSAKLELERKSAEDASVLREKIRKETEVLLEEEKNRLQKEYIKKAKEIEDKARDQIARERIAAINEAKAQIIEATQPKAAYPGALASNDNDGIALAASVRQGLDLNAVSLERQVERSNYAVGKMVARAETSALTDMAIEFKNRVYEIRDIGSSNPPKTKRESQAAASIRWEAMEIALRSQSQREAALHNELADLGKEMRARYRSELRDMSFAAIEAGYTMEMIEAFDRRSKKIAAEFRARSKEAIATIYQNFSLAEDGNQSNKPRKDSYLECFFETMENNVFLLDSLF